MTYIALNLWISSLCRPPLFLRLNYLPILPNILPFIVWHPLYFFSLYWTTYNLQKAGRTVSVLWIWYKEPKCSRCEASWAWCEADRITGDPQISASVPPSISHVHGSTPTRDSPVTLRGIRGQFENHCFKIMKLLCCNNKEVLLKYFSSLKK